MNKHYLLILGLFVTQLVFTQIAVTVNGKKVSAGQEITYSDIQTMSVSFTNPAKLPTYSDGYVLLSCGFFDESGNRKKIEYISKKVEGASGINVFLNQKTPKEYQLAPLKPEPDLVGWAYNKPQFNTICEQYKTSPFGGKVKLVFELSYYELTGWHWDTDHGTTRMNEYADAVELIDPFEITLKIADKNALLAISPLQAKFSMNDVADLGFVELDTTLYWNDLGDVTGSGESKA